MIKNLVFLCIASSLNGKSLPSDSQQDDLLSVIQEGHISLNDSEVILLINNTFEIIEDFDEDNTTDLESNSTEGESTSNKPHFSKLRPSGTCTPWSRSQKYSMLERIGARNQMLLADSPEEASIGFAALYRSEDLPYNDDVPYAVPPHEEEYCDATCRKIRKALKDAMSQPENNSTIVLSDEPPSFGAVGGCVLENFVPVEECTDLGQEASLDYEHLCSECRGIYILSSNCFPNFLNSVHCNAKELGCIFESSSRPHGECREQSLPIKVLRNAGDSNCEKWVPEDIEIPVACQCLLSRSSWLHSRPPQEL